MGLHPPEPIIIIVVIIYLSGPVGEILEYAVGRNFLTHCSSEWETLGTF